MDKIMTDTRGNDLGGLRKQSMAYLVENKKDPSGGIRTDTGDKSRRGFYNLTTARMLTPYIHLNDFDQDPERYVSSVQYIVF